MRTIRRMTVAALLLVLAVPLRALAQTATVETTSAKTWIGRAAEIEQHIKTAKVLKLQDIPLGVTKPRHGYLAPGGPVDEIAWKTIRPGIHGGFWESYQSDIAAYEMDKLLGLDMIPPTVEREVDHERGAAVMWVSPVKSFKELGGPPSAPPQHLERWNRQLIRSKMFDNLINNIDPNLGNWLVDPAWNLILIDHTRSFTSGKKMVHKMGRIDPELWEKMKGLTYESVAGAAGKWLLGKGEIRGILERRDRMKVEIDKLVAEKGEAEVFIK